MKNRRQHKKQFVSQKSYIKLDWFELLDLKYVLRDYLCRKFKFRNTVKKYHPNDKSLIDNLLISEQKMIQLYKEVLEKINNYE